MAASCLPSFSVSSVILRNRMIIASLETPLAQPWVSSQFTRLSRCSMSLFWGAKRENARVSSALALVNEEPVMEEGAEEASQNDEFSSEELLKKPRPCELYVCNLPRRYDIPQLLEMFKSYGTVLSVEVSRNPQTGESRGCGYVTMSSINSAKKAIFALDRTDVGGREMRVRYSVDMNPRSRNASVLNSTPKKMLIYESPYKVYIGNLSWTTKPDELRNLFSRFGSVVSVRVLHDRKRGKNRVFGFVSFSSLQERDAAVALDGTEFQGRRIIVREGVERTED